MSKHALSRRDFLRAVSENTRNSLIALSMPAIVLAGQQAQAAQSAARPLTTLGSAEAADLEVIAARIIPTDTTPGAKEAGVIYFMDQVLGNERAEVLPALRKGLLDLQRSVAGRFGGPALAELPDGILDGVLREIEDGAFFNTVRYLTIAGMFTSPVHGGNQDKVGWQLIGFEDRHAWMAPYGYYDAEYMELGE